MIFVSFTGRKPIFKKLTQPNRCLQSILLVEGDPEFSGFKFIAEKLMLKNTIYSCDLFEKL